VQTAKKAGAGKSAWRTGNDVDFSDGLLCAKKKKIDFAGKSIFF